MSQGDSRILSIALEATRRLVPEACLGAVIEGLLGVAGGEWGLAFLVSDDGNDLRLVAAKGEEGALELGKAFDPLDAGLIRHLTPEGPLRLDQARPLLAGGQGSGAWEDRLGAALLAPLYSSAGRVGLILLLAGAGRGFEPDAEVVCEGLSRAVAPALDNLRTVTSLRELVIRDDTADCFNRRYLDQTLEDEAERSRRFGGRFAAIFLDMDNLKEINTRHGHAAGSRVLYEASVRMSRSIRSIDRLFRYGGDEFVVLLPGTTLKGAREVAERIRQEVAGTPFEVAPGALVALTASAGVSAWPEHGRSGRRVVEAADAAMRGVKAAGKNDIAVAPLPGGLRDAEPKR